MEVHIGYAYLPENISPALVQRMSTVVRGGLLSFVNFNKEIHSLAQSLAGRLILQNLLIINDINIDDIALSLSNYKKPIIKNSEYKFSISHSGNMVACAFSVESNPGIDVELKKEIAVTDFQSQFSEREWAEVCADRDHIAFYRIWTAKEAISKAIGAGLYLAFNKIKLVENHIYEVDGEQWVTEQIAIDPAYICTLAGRNSWFQKYLHQINIEI